ncbi:MAG TPA: hypothetical protein VFK23_04635, partial [Nitrospirota bacterium]|nr:hypothetical protein [Nitrospirota bacterium]
EDVTGLFSPCLMKKIPVICFTMQFRAFLIMLLLAMVVAAPVVDATICEDCNHAAPVLDPSQRLIDPAGSAATISGAPGTDSPGTESAQDLCPFCSHSVAATVSPACYIPSTISNAFPLPKLLALFNLSKSITKPPQN